jgi:hypothetical protein
VVQVVRSEGLTVTSCGTSKGSTFHEPGEASPAHQRAALPGDFGLGAVMEGECALGSARYAPDLPDCFAREESRTPFA